ncbi:hypothetical protein PI23P_08270 [Polaribacter irgensii 23-P]|uniref:Uncharacterized protein n=1 Tax=Polaribacter irgensii 23-P TaxID=313594 RepID=A4BZL3_9FLAO|nr:hypothetical protein PI23P_08270 [Polaribacter irgensii 23-P]
MNKVPYFIILTVVLFIAYSKNESTDLETNDGSPMVETDPSYMVVKE